MRVINARLDKQKTPASTPVVVLFFVLRLTVFAGVIYGSLKCFHGSIVALFFGVALAAADHYLGGDPTDARLMARANSTETRLQKSLRLSS